MAVFGDSLKGLHKSLSTMGGGGSDNESIVCPCSRAYMRGENGKESLMVCLSEYQICTVNFLV